MSAWMHARASFVKRNVPKPYPWLRPVAGSRCTDTDSCVAAGADTGRRKVGE